MRVARANPRPFRTPTARPGGDERGTARRRRARRPGRLLLPPAKRRLRPRPIRPTHPPWPGRQRGRARGRRAGRGSRRGGETSEPPACTAPVAASTPAVPRRFPPPRPLRLAATSVDDRLALLAHELLDVVEAAPRLAGG